MTQSTGIWRKVSILTLAGGTAFSITNFAISLTPIAAEYRAALSIPYFPVLLEAMVGGLMIGFGVSYSLLRFFDKLPTRNSILKSVIISLIVLLIVTLIVEVPAKFLTPLNNALRYFLIGALFNILRIPALGVVIGYLYKRLSKTADNP